MGKKQAKKIDNRPAYLILALLFIIYLLTKLPAFGFFVALAVVAVFALEIYGGILSHGWKKELKEIGVGVLVALVFWFGMGFVLGTPAPLDAVVSCSMLPNIDRGDLVVVQGGMGAAPEVEINGSVFSELLSSPVCGICRTGNVERPCAIDSATSKEARQEGSVRYECGMCKSIVKGTQEEIPCVLSLRIGNRVFYENRSNDIVLYEPLPTDAFYGMRPIIHRAFLKLNKNGEIFYLVKGDNNNQLDVQVGNAPVSSGKIVGKMLARIPYMGYFKLLLWGHLSAPAGCERLLLGES